MPFEHYGAVIQPLLEKYFTKRTHCRHTFYYHLGDKKLLGLDDTITVRELDRVICNYVTFTPQQSTGVKYVVGLCNGKGGHLIMVTVGNRTKVIAVTPFLQVGVSFTMDRGVSEPILGLTDFICWTKEEKREDISVPSFLDAQALANDILKRHTKGEQVVKVIYRKGEQDV